MGSYGSYSRRCAASGAACHPRACGLGPGGVCTGGPDGSVDVAQDVVGLLDKFANINALPKAMTDFEPGNDRIHDGPDLKVNISRDVLDALEAFGGLPYPFEPEGPLPCGAD